MNATKTTEEQIKEVIVSINDMVDESRKDNKLFIDSEAIFLKWLKENNFIIFSEIINKGKCTFTIQTNHYLNELYNRNSKYTSHLHRLFAKYFCNEKIKAVINKKLGEDSDEIVFTQSLDLL